MTQKEVQLSIHGDAWRLRDASGVPTDTVVTSRRHTLSKVRSHLIAMDWLAWIAIDYPS